MRGVGRGNREPSRESDIPSLNLPWIAGGLFLVVVLVYLPSLRNSFVDWDDQAYVVRNQHVAHLSWTTVQWALTSFEHGNWHPVTWISHALDRQLWGLDPRGHHLTSVLLHAANAVLVLLVLVRISGWRWRSAAAAAVFALHPLRVESVAWVAERKDLLCALFVLLTVLAYLRYVPRRTPTSFLLVVLAFAAALASKPMAVTVPAVLLLLDFWPLKRAIRSPVRALVAEKLPLLALACVVAVVTYVAQDRGDAVRPWDAIGPVDRVSNAAVATATYLGQTLWPVPGTLLPLYTHPHWLPGGLASSRVWGAALTLGMISAVCFRERRRRPYLLAGWLWYLIMLTPVSGLIQVGSQSHADRYTYLPLLGPLLAAMWLTSDLIGDRAGRRRFAALATFSALVLLCALTWKQQRVWRDAVFLWEHTVRGQPSSPIAHLNLANAYHAAGRDAGASRHYQQAIALGPRYSPAHAALGVREGEKRRYELAVGHLETALRLDPDDVHTRASLGNTLLAMGQIDSGLEHLERAVTSEPSNVLIRNSLAKGLVEAQRLETAIAVYQGTLALDPASAAAHNNLAVAYLRAHRSREGIALLRKAVLLDPSYRAGHRNLALALGEAGDTEGAKHHLDLAKRPE